MTVTTRLSARALAALLPDLSSERGPAYSALARSIASLLMDGRMVPGTQLPSERDLAQWLGVSRATVTAAYNLLRQQDIVQSRTGSGSVVQLPPGMAAGSASGPLSAPGSSMVGLAGKWRAPASPLDRTGIAAPRDPVSSPGDDAGGPVLIDLTSAAFPAPAELMAAVARAAARLPEFTDGSGYEPAGTMRLRQAIAARFAARGLDTTANQILVTNGAMHGLDLLLRLFSGPGERVLTELPTYSGLIDGIRAHGARPLAVPMAPTGGWQLAAMTAALRQNRPGLAMLVPDFHNPTGALIGEAERIDVLREARRVSTTVVVDESFVDLGFVAPIRPTAALDPAVITVGSMSKPVWGGLRTGWIRASRSIIDQLVVVRAAMDMGQDVLGQLVAEEMFGQLDSITSRRRGELRPRRDHLRQRLAERLPAWRSIEPQGGASLWVELDEARATALSMRAAQYGVRIVAGSRFGIDGTMERFLRLPYALPEATLSRAVDRIAAAWADVDGVSGGYSPLIVA